MENKNDVQLKTKKRGEKAQNQNKDKPEQGMHVRLDDISLLSHDFY